MSFPKVMILSAICAALGIFVWSTVSSFLKSDDKVGETVQLTPHPDQPNPERQIVNVASTVPDSASTQDETPNEQSPSLVVKLDESKPTAFTTPVNPQSTSEEADSKTADELTKHFDKQLKPLLELTVGDNDKKLAKKSLQLLKKGKFSQQKKLKSKISNEAVNGLVSWYAMKQGGLPETFSALKTHREAHLDWPGIKRIRRKEESLLFRDQSAPEKIIAYFEKAPPVSAEGRLALAGAYQKTKKTDEAATIIKELWHRHTLSKSLEKKILTDFGEHLDKKDHKTRADFFVYEGKKSKYQIAKRASARLSKSEQKKIRARIAALRGAKNTGKLIKGLSKEEKADPGVLFARARYARRRKNDALAWKLLKSAPTTLVEQVNPDAWWKEQRIHVRNALNKGHRQTAYDIAARRGPVTVNYLNQAEFMAGWIALRFLKKPELAKKHFTAFAKSADGPRTRSRSNYWLARTALVMKDSALAKQYFEKSAKHFNTFYGQLSLQALEPNTSKIKVPELELPSEESHGRFIARGSVRAMIAAHRLGRKDLANKFLRHLRYALNEPGELTLLAELAKRLGYTQQSVRIGKRGMFLNFPMTDYAYPVHAMPDFKPLRQLPEQAVLFAITRQESEFNTKIVSHAGARGLMQVMPITARHVARDHKIKYQRARLLSDPAYNARIASAYIADRLDDFKGNYAVTMAGYNAGPGRVRQWMKLFGDPRKANVDPIDWIERIPFEETRNYVKKVLANIQVYRARLGEADKALRLVDDLHRAKKGGVVKYMRATF